MIGKIMGLLVKSIEIVQNVWLKKQIIVSEVRIIAHFFVLLHLIYVWRPMGAMFFDVINDVRKYNRNNKQK